MSKEYDWIIVGAGPAGSTLARLLANRGRVLLLDRRALDRPWQPGTPGKCCGGLLAPDAQRALAQFGLALPESALGGPQIFAVHAIDLTNDIERYYQRFYLNLDREEFDRWLANLAVDAGAEPCYGAEWLSFENNEVRYRRGGAVHSAKCRYLIAADGAASTVRRKLESGRERNQSKDCYVAIQEQYEKLDDSPFFSAFFDHELTDFYGWSIPKNDSLLFGAAFRPESGAPEKFAKLKSRLEARGMKFGKTLHRDGSLIWRPCRRRNIWLGEGPVFAIGEAAGWVSPSSAEGFSYAFESAALLAGLFAAKTTPAVHDYRCKCHKLFLNLTSKVVKIPAMYSPPLRNIIMKSGLTAIKVKK